MRSHSATNSAVPIISMYDSVPPVQLGKLHASNEPISPSVACESTPSSRQRGFQRLDRQVARLHFFHRRLLGSQREGLFQARPQILLATFRVFVETGAIL